MDYRSQLPTAQPLSSYARQSESATPSNFNSQLNPSVPGFQPIGVEMQRYQQFPPTPPSTGHAQSNELSHMRNYLLNSHFTQTKEIVGLQRSIERHTQDHFDEFENMKSMVKRDLRTLESQIKDLKAQAASKQQGDDTISKRKSVYDRPALDRLGKDFNRDGLAETYIEEAETMEATAKKLREQAAELTGRNTPKVFDTMKLLEGAKDMAKMSRYKADSACCGKKYKSIQDLLEHVHTKHASDLSANEKSPNAGGDETPTHMPPRRVKPATTVEIKPEESTEMKDLKVELAEVKTLLAKKDQDAAVTQRASPSVEKPWIPLAVRQMPTVPALNIENDRKDTFTWEFLNSTFRGKQWSPGYYFVSKNSTLPTKSYWILEAEYEPHLPKEPGQHGAKLTAFFNATESMPGEAPDESNYLNVPVFILAPGANEYVYFGNYSQKRFSDKLDYDTLMDKVPAHVREYWAMQLSDPGRPLWVTKELRNYFWPKPTYTGPIPTDSAVATPVTEDTKETAASDILEMRVTSALHKYALDLKEWRKDAEVRVHRITARNLLDAFENADADVDPGLRLWWEYFEFEKYDHAFMSHLIAKKNCQKPAATAPLAQKAMTTVRTDQTVQPTSDAETIIPVSPTKLERARNAPATTTWKTGPMRNALSVKPVQQPSNTAKTENTKPSDDLQAAKAIQADAKTNCAPGHGRDKDGKKPPHLRHGR